MSTKQPIAKNETNGAMIPTSASHVTFGNTGRPGTVERTSR
jgi:hypothetical protein